MTESGRSLGLAAALLAAAAAGAQPETTDSVDAAMLRGIRDALVSAEDFSAALEPAEQVVATTAAEHDEAAIDDVMRLARIQAELDMFDQAELNYLEAIDRLAEQGASTVLAEAYRALGRAYIHEGDFTSALGVLEQARHLSQREAGLYNVEQSGVIDDLTLAHLALGDTFAARRLQLERLDNAKRRFGADDPRVVPFHNHLADYYDRSRLRVSAREQYARSLEIQESAYGELDPRLLPTLRALLGIDLALGRVDDDDVPERIERILDARDDVAARERSESLAALGDRALIRDAAADAESYYARAYGALAPEDAAAAFARPRLLDFVAPLSAVDRAARNRPYAWGRIELELDVSAQGRAENVTVIRIEPAARIGNDFVQRLREAHLRPRLLDGVPAATHGVKFSHDFRYYMARDED